jgi:hypothetical protein
MGIGIECYDRNNRLVFSSADRLGRIIGQRWTNQLAAGGIYVAEWEAPDVIPWVASVPFANLFQAPYGINPSVWVENKNVRWQYGTTSTGNLANALLIWGVR